LLLDLEDLEVVLSPDDGHALGLGHVLVPLEVLLLVLLIGSGLEYLYLKCHEVISEGLEDDEHDIAYDHFIHIVVVLDPDVLETYDVLPTPFDTFVLISMQELQWYLVSQLQGKVKENVGLQPVFQDILELKVLFIWPKELMVLIYHDHAHYYIAKREQTSSQDC
jgi:hypothetical protein